jgi:hypothetical protein
VKITWDPASKHADQARRRQGASPVAVPADDDNVKRIKIQSQILTKWWGQPDLPWRDGAVCRRTTTSIPT